MPTPGQISKENLKEILAFVPVVVYNICVVLFSSQLNYTTQKRICPSFGLQILFCLVGAFFHSPTHPSPKPRETIRLLRSRYLDATLTMNPGNHFFEPDARLSRLIEALAL